MYYDSLNEPALHREFEAVKRRYEAFRSRNMSLDMSRGKPGPEQMDISSEIFDVVGNAMGFQNATGIDCRNYGGLDGLPELKTLFAEILGVEPSQVIVGGNSSLNMMFDTIAQAMTHGFSGKPWMLQEKIKFLCPSPGYDRHFAICEHFGIEMIPVDNTPDGPDMDQVEALVQDSAVKGIWCVPKYSNPQGIIYSDAVIDRIAHLRPAAPDFALMWDNAYCIHELFCEFVPFADMLSVCRAAGNPDMVYEFASTSKITFPGAGVAVMAASVDNQNYLKKLLNFQTISYDKVNQLRHVRYLKDKAHTLALMQRHAAVLAPKFRAVLDLLGQELGPRGLATWTEPKGGYFISCDTMPGTAKRALALCAQAGVTMTPAGATFPYGKDPLDSNVRIAPSLPPVAELKQAMEVFCLCVRMAALERLGL